ncbi:unnamed protein product [Schistosoma margrebowiei]|uniref:Uncharacterized protein n=1 Tax=Schistosoma margrebowiei TaxID=48269 RepID=A0A183LUY2_9TREM|nr:unnamed protein product [Schistosoma margrebowiei]
MLPKEARKALIGWESHGIRITKASLKARNEGITVYIIRCYAPTNDSDKDDIVACVLVGLSLAETEIEYIHDHGDMILTKVLLSNGLMGTNDEYTNQFYLDKNNNNNQLMINRDSTGGNFNLEDNTAINGLSSSSSSGGVGSGSSGSSISSSTDNDRLGLSGEFALLLTPPLSSFFLLISADFIYLLSFLSVLIYFVRLCEKAEADRKQMKCAETTSSV